MCRTTLTPVRELKQRFPLFDWTSFFEHLLPKSVYHEQYSEDFEVELISPVYMKKVRRC